VRNIVLAVALSTIGFSSVSADAHEQMILAKQSSTAPSSYQGLDSHKVLAIGAGIIIGATTGYWVFTFPGATLLSAAVGGVIGGWWYGPDANAGIEPLPRRNTP
jgi:hypothetical protein